MDSAALTIPASSSKVRRPRIPQTRTTVMAATIAVARMLKTIGTPSTCGAAATTCGILDTAVE